MAEISTPSHASRNPVLAFSAVVLCLLWAMYLRMGDELIDDGAFFLRYAVNAANGQFWVWNPGEQPVWGASAPLYPMLVAVPIALGMKPLPAIVATSMVLSCIGFSAIIFLVRKHVGMLAAISLLCFLVLDSNLMWMSVNGLESPLTVVLMAAALWVLLDRTSALVAGLVAGLLMVNKIDLLPVGGALLLALWFREGRLPRLAFAVAGIVAAIWYGFAWWYFGAPVPNSFLTKALHQDNLPKSIDWTWFGHLVLWQGIHKWLVLLSVIAAVLADRNLRPVIVFLALSIAVHVVAYSIKYPFEPYNWYAIPSILALAFGAALGLGLAARALAPRLPGGAAAACSLTVVLLLVAIASSLPEERAATRWMRMFTSNHEFDRAQAGRWVAENTPREFRVFTMWGNPAHFSDRYVFDGSFLNRPYEPGNMVERYRPEIIILQAEQGAAPTSPMPVWLADTDYEVIRVFDRTYQAGMDYFFIVLARSDVLDQLPEPELPRDIMPFVRDVTLGNTYGVLEDRGGAFLFVHPGETTATSFTLDPVPFSRADGTCAVSLHARIADNLPRNAAENGGGVVRLTILRDDGGELASRTITPTAPFRSTIPCAVNSPLRFVVDPEGSPYTDWLRLTLN